MIDTDVPALWLRRRAEHRLRNGHVWVFSNEVDTKKTALTSFVPGQLVEVHNSAGKLLGVAQVNPKALICARLISRRSAAELPANWVEDRLAVAKAWRDNLFTEPFYRLVYGESDGLPGMVVDRHGDVLVVQFNSIGAESLRQRVLDALLVDLAPTAIVLRNDAPARFLEGLPQERAVVYGALPDRVEIAENGVRFAIDPLNGQKTGWYYDHRENRRHAAALCTGRSVLDVFCYTGGWGVQCAAKGAARVHAVDSSEAALAWVRHNADMNGKADVVSVEQGDAFKLLRELRNRGERFDRVIVDPPAFIRRRKDRRAGLEAYRRLNLMAMQVLADNGILFSASCSSHLSEDELQECVRSAAARMGAQAQILGWGYQGPDHPVLPGLPESRYIKCVTSRLAQS